MKPCFYRERIDALGPLPEDWVTRLRASWDQHRTEAVLQYRDESGATKEMTIASVEGDAIRIALPWLHELYHGPIRTWAAATHGLSLRAGDRSASSVNVKLLRGRGLECDRHVDGVPVVVMLYASTAPEDGGGEIVFHREGEAPAVHRPGVGDLVTFLGDQVPHEVVPVRGGWERLSVAMNYFLAEQIAGNAASMTKQPSSSLA